MRFTIALFSFVFLNLIVVSCGNNDQVARNYQKDSLTSKLEQYINAWAENKRFNGTLFIAKKDTVLFHKAYGMAVREHNVSNTDSTKFLIGSITKTFTAYALLLLEQQGKLSIEDTLNQYFPDFPNAEKIQLKHLLMHTSGITDYHAFKRWIEDSKLDITPLHTLSTLMERPILFEPGTQFSYSNSGYILLGLIIEKVSGQKFEEFLTENILNPLELFQTGVASNSRLIPNLASGYTTNPRETQKAPYINYNQPFTSGNMYSTCTDLWKFTTAVMKSNLLPAAKTAEIFESSDRYGYGWGIRNYLDKKAYGHMGAMNGFVSSMTYLPEEEYFICFLTNDDNTPEYTITEDLVALVLGQEVALPQKEQLIVLSNEKKEQVVGDYLVKPGDTLHVFLKDESVYLQETGQLAHELFPTDSLEFAFTLFEFKAVFSASTNNEIDTLKFVGKSKVVASRVE